MDKFMSQLPPQPDWTDDIQLFYKNHTSSSYKQDEKALKRISENVKLSKSESQLKPTIYYKSRCTSSLV